MVGLHLSRLAEDLIIYATKEFDFIEIADDFSTGSSLMPQKRNPDSLELVRGMSGNLFSCLTGIMMTIKGTPSTYNKDLQFDKQYCFEAFDKLQQALMVTQGVVKTMKLKMQHMESALSADMLATDWVSFRVIWFWFWEFVMELSSFLAGLLSGTQGSALPKGLSLYWGCGGPCRTHVLGHQ